MDQFARDIVAAYPEELRRRTGTGLTLLDAHRAAMSAAAAKVDPDHGKRRLRRLSGAERSELEEALLRAVA